MKHWAILKCPGGTNRSQSRTSHTALLGIADPQTIGFTANSSRNPQPTSNSLSFAFELAQILAGKSVIITFDRGGDSAAA